MAAGAVKHGEAIEEWIKTSHVLGVEHRLSSYLGFIYRVMQSGTIMTMDGR